MGIVASLARPSGKFGWNAAEFPLARLGAPRLEINSSQGTAVHSVTMVYHYCRWTGYLYVIDCTKEAVWVPTCVVDLRRSLKTFLKYLILVLNCRIFGITS